MTLQRAILLLYDGEEIVRSYKFYFLDEDQELISLSSQNDFEDNSEYIQQSIALLVLAEFTCCYTIISYVYPGKLRSDNG